MRCLAIKGILFQSVEDLILKQLVADYKQIAYQFRLELKVPVLVLTDISSIWGRWNPHTRTIELRRTLINEYSWDTVLYVLKHEMAHQVVTEIFGLPDSDHAESFQKACDLLHLPHEFRSGRGELNEPQSWKHKSQKTETITSIVDRVNKLLALASSTNEAEAAVAMTKAHELMRKYNIAANLNLDPKDKEDFRFLLFDTGKQRLSPVFSHLASMLIHYYNVDVIFTSKFNAQTLRSTQFLEIYGRETHVIVAEYVLHFMLRTLESLWRDHAHKTGASALQKKSFQLGLLSGFQQKLEAEAQAPVVSDAPSATGLQSTKHLLRLEDSARRLFVEQRYPRLRSRSSGRSQIDTHMYQKGVESGRSVEIRKGIRTGQSLIRALKGSVLR